MDMPPLLRIMYISAIKNDNTINDIKFFAFGKLTQTYEVLMGYGLGKFRQFMKNLRHSYANLLNH